VTAQYRVAVPAPPVRMTARWARHLQAAGRIPTLRRPVVNAGRVVVALENEVAITGPTRLVLRGPASRASLRLLALMDGTRDMVALASGADLSPEQAGDVVALLNARGVLEEADAEAETVLRAQPSARYLSPRLAATGFDTTTRGALDRIATTKTLVAGAGPLADLLVQELRAGGVTRAIRVAPEEAATADLADAGLVVGIFEGCEEHAVDFGLAARRHGVAMLRVHAKGTAFELGPYFDPAQGACTRCFARWHQASQDATAGDPSGPDTIREAVAIACVDVTTLIAKVHDVFPVGRVRRCDLASWDSEVRLAPAFPECEVCGAGTGMGEAEIAMAYEQLVEPTRPALEAPRAGVKVPSQWSLLIKDYPGSPRVRLAASPDPEPHGVLCGPRVAAAPRTLDRQTVSGILKRSFGVTGEALDRSSTPRRYAPTGGNMASVQPYVIAMGIDGLPEGTPCFYDSYEHELVRVAQRPMEPRDLDSVFVDVPGTPAMMIFLTAGIEVAEAKYQDFSLKLTFMDCGCAVTQLRRVVQGYGVRADMAPRWDPALLADVLGIDLMTEPIVCVLKVAPT
jgi:SagB-type dehydrogenase family enzyme